MSSIVFEIVVILLLLVVNGVFAMSEIAVVTARESRLARRASGGDTRAAGALALKAEPTEFLSTVQVGITMVGVLAGAFGGATLAAHLDDALERFTWLAPYSEVLSFVVVVAAITYLSLIIGELVPKRIAMSDPEGIASRIAGPMRVLGKVGSPLVRMLSASTNVLLALLPLRAAEEGAVSEDDIRAMVRHAAATGAIHEAEEDIVERVLSLGDRQVSDVITPRPDVDWIDIDTPQDELAAELASRPRARYLVCEGEIDRVLGFVRASDLFAQVLSGSALSLKPLILTPLFVPASQPLIRLLELFRQSEIRAAVALDEFGGVQGVVTMDDVLRDLVVDIPGLVTPDDDIVRRDDGTFLISGSTPMDDVRAALGPEAATLRIQDSRGYRTLAGMVMTTLGHVPRTGERFEIDSYRFEVVDMDGRRIDRVLVTPLE